MTAMNCSIPKYIHDAFNLAKYSEYNSHRQDFVVVDHHSYFVFTDKDNTESASGHTQDVGSSIATNLAAHSSQQRGNLIIGEWSCALSSQSMKKENDPEASQKEFCTRQMETYGANTAGWTFWCTSSGLSDLSGTHAGLLPSLHERRMPSRSRLVFQIRCGQQAST